MTNKQNFSTDENYRIFFMENISNQTSQKPEVTFTEYCVFSSSTLFTCVTSSCQSSCKKQKLHVRLTLFIDLVQHSFGNEFPQLTFIV